MSLFQVYPEYIHPDNLPEGCPGWGKYQMGYDICINCTYNIDCMTSETFHSNKANDHKIDKYINSDKSISTSEGTNKMTDLSNTNQENPQDHISYYEQAFLDLNCYVVCSSMDCYWQFPGYRKTYYGSFEFEVYRCELGEDGSIYFEPRIIDDEALTNYKDAELFCKVYVSDYHNDVMYIAPESGRNLIWLWTIEDINHFGELLKRIHHLAKNELIPNYYELQDKVEEIKRQKAKSEEGA